MQNLQLDLTISYLQEGWSYFLSVLVPCRFFFWQQQFCELKHTAERSL